MEKYAYISPYGNLCKTINFFIFATAVTFVKDLLRDFIFKTYVGNLKRLSVNFNQGLFYLHEARMLLLNKTLTETTENHYFARGYGKGNI